MMADGNPTPGRERPPTTPPASSPDPTRDALQAASPILARVFDNSPVGMLIAAADGRILAVNDALARMLGFSAAALRGRAPAELGLLDAADGRALDEARRAAAGDSPAGDLPGDEAPDVVLRLTGGDGQPRDVVVSVQPLELDGRPHTISLYQDLSEFTHLSAGLAQSERRFRLFFENAPLALIVSDAAGREIVDANPAACRQYGYSHAEFLALSGAARAALLAAAPRPTEAPAPARQTTADGRRLDVEVTTFDFSLGGRRLRMIALRDVTAQTAAAAALADRERRFRIVADMSNDGVWDWDLRRNEIHVYDTAPADPRPPATRPAAAQPWSRRIHPDDRARARTQFEAAATAGRPGWQVEYRVARPEGGWATVLERGAILYEDRRPVRALAATVDITAPMQTAEAQAQAAQAERQRLARELHDSVTQSLYSVTLLAEAARRHAQERQETAAADYIGRLGGLAHQALRQMRLLVYELRPSVLDTEGLVGALRHRLDAVEKRAGLAVSFIVRGERALPPRLQGELYRLAHEALNNALKHAAATAVTVRLDTLGDNVWLEVADDGLGFDPAERRDGAGLAMMAEHCRRLGGDMAVVSRPGQGTIVRVVVPPAGDSQEDATLWGPPDEWPSHGVA